MVWLKKSGTDHNAGVSNGGKISQPIHRHMWSPTHSTHLCRIQEAMTPVYIFACVLVKKCSCATTFMADSIPMIPIWDWDLLLLNIMGSIARRHLELIADDLIFTSNDVELISFETCDCGQVMTNSKWVW